MIPAGVPMMSVLRTCISMASHFDPVEGQELDALKRRAIWLLAVASDIVAARYRLLNQKEPILPKPGVSHAHQMLYMFHGTEPDELSVRLLDMTLLYAEHDFNASTFTNRVVASTASMTSATWRIGALKGATRWSERRGDQPDSAVRRRRRPGSG
jgi:citrate synthase